MYRNNACSRISFQSSSGRAGHCGIPRPSSVPTFQPLPLEVKLSGASGQIVPTPNQGCDHPLKLVIVLSVLVICSWNIYSPGQLAEVEWWPGATLLSLQLSPASVFPVPVVLTTLEMAKQGSQPIEETSTVYTPESGLLSVTPGVTARDKVWSKLGWRCRDVESHRP